MCMPRKGSSMRTSYNDNSTSFPPYQGNGHAHGSFEEHENSAELRQEALLKLRKTAYAYLDVARHELNQILSAFGLKAAYGSVAILAGVLGFAWLTVLLGLYLSTLWGWFMASFVVSVVMFAITGVAYALQKKQNQKAKEAVQEIGNEILNGRIDAAQNELEEAFQAATRETLHDVRPDVVLKKFVVKNPNSAVIGSVLAGALVGYAQMRKK